MIQTTTEASVRAIIESKIPQIEMLEFRNPAKYDGGTNGHFGFFNPETGNALQHFTAKEGYEMTTVDDYVTLASAALDAMDGEGTVKAIWTESKSTAQATIIVEPTREKRLSIFDIGGNDPIWPRLIIEAPFGRTAKIQAGFMRDACRNLCIPSHIKGTGFESILRHTANLRIRMDEIIETCRRATNFTAMCEQMNALNNVEIDIAEQLAKLYPIEENASENTLTRAKNRAAKIYDRIYREAIKLDGTTGRKDKTSLWRLIQAVTGYVQHDKTRKGNASETERAIVALNDPETNAAWSLVEMTA